LQEHLSKEQIDRYVARSGDADEIIAIAEHLDACFDCRDRVAAIVDPGTGERPHHGPTSGRTSGRVSAMRDTAERSRAKGLVPWIIVAIIVAAIVLALAIAR
jgi:anti-sigma factor ChrR (cupin superfamily)